MFSNTRNRFQQKKTWFWVNPAGGTFKGNFHFSFLTGKFSEDHMQREKISFGKTYSVIFLLSAPSNQHVWPKRSEVEGPACFLIPEWDDAGLFPHCNVNKRKSTDFKDAYKAITLAKNKSRNMDEYIFIFKKEWILLFLWQQRLAQNYGKATWQNVSENLEKPSFSQ